MKRNLAIVHWLDAWSSPGSDLEYDFDKEKGYKSYTVGFIIKDNAKGISLAMCAQPGSGAELRNVFFIPRGMIKKVTKLSHETT